MRIEELFRKIDDAIKIGLPSFFMDKKNYGIVQTLRNKDGKLSLISDTELDIESGELAIYDDRYSIAWAHKIDSITFNNRNKNSLSSTTNMEISGISIFWSKRKILTSNNSYVFVSQPQLAEKLIYILSRIEFYKINKVDFDMYNIEKQEFLTERLHKESNLLKINFHIQTFLGSICVQTC